MPRFKKGDRVIYKNEDAGYYLGKSNPLWGTKFYCEGRISKVHDETYNVYSFAYRVLWDNGRYNSYADRDLELVNQEPDWEV